MAPKPRPAGPTTPPFDWVTSAADGQEHAVPDPDPHRPTDPAPARVAFCGHRVLPRRCSLLVPPGPRCEGCARRVRRSRAEPRHPLLRAAKRALGL
jgi:hypothetical protein